MTSRAPLAGLLAAAVLSTAGQCGGGTPADPCQQLRSEVDHARRDSADHPADDRRHRAYLQARQAYRDRHCPGTV